MFFYTLGTSVVLRKIARGGGVLRESSRGSAVALIQGGLVALGFEESDCNGSFKRRLTWTQGSEIAKAQLYPTGGM